MKEKNFIHKSPRHRLAGFLPLFLFCLCIFIMGIRAQAADGQRATVKNPAYTLTSTKDTAVSTKANPNETTVLIFGHTGCGYTRSTLNSLSSCNWIKRSDVRVIFAETNGHTKEEVSAYEAGYQCPDITFCYDEDNGIFMAMVGYTQLFGMSGGKFPTIVLIDKDNNIQNILTGTKTSNELLAEIKKFADIDDSGSTTPTEPGVGYENIVYGLNSIDGSVVSTKANPNETTVLIFGYTTCGNTKATLQSINQSDWVSRSDIRVIFADVYGAMPDETQAFAQNYSGNGIIFCHDESFLNYNLALTYLNLEKLTGGEFPYIVLIDKNNRVRSITLGPKTASDIITEIDKLNTPEHEWETEYRIDKEPTCTTAGSKSIHCKKCDAAKDSVSIPAIGHKLTATAAKAATCTATGNRAYWRCTVCKKYYSDAAGTQETTLDATAIKAKGHAYKTTVSKATPKKNGGITKKCTACGHSAGTSVIYRPAKITLSATSYTYNGKQQKPKVTVTDSKGGVISPANYTLSYSKNKAVGKAAVKITWKNNYSGTSSASFTIRPKGTSLTKATATSKRITVKWKKQASQTSGYQIQYSTDKKFPSKATVTKKAAAASSQTLATKNLKVKNPKNVKKCYIRIQTYKTVNGTTYYSKWSAIKTVILKNKK